MVAKIHDKNVIVICDCIGCKNRPTWQQEFKTKKGPIIVDLCEDHHFILRTKVPKDIPLNEDVLKWLLMQDSNPYRVVKYGIITGPSDIEFLRELDKIEIELE
jgi:hypothetical protein